MSQHGKQRIKERLKTNKYVRVAKKAYYNGLTLNKAGPLTSYLKTFDCEDIRLYLRHVYIFINKGDYVLLNSVIPIAEQYYDLEDSMKEKKKTIKTMQRWSTSLTKKK